VVEGVKKFLWRKGARDTISLRFWDLPKTDASLLTGFVDLRSLVLCAPFFASCEAIEFAEMGYRREECPDLLAILLVVLHALRLECENSMELTASSYRSCLFWSSRKSRDEEALSESVPTGPQRKER